MTIIGLQQYREDKRSSWTAKCDCGNYEYRNHRSWQQNMKKGIPDGCIICMPMELRRTLFDLYWLSQGSPPKNSQFGE